jgi:hypothetical protein
MSEIIDWDNSETRKEILIQRIINHICDDGWNRENILQLMANNPQFDLTEERVNELVDIALERLNALYYTPECIEQTFKQHITWYEHAYAYFKRINHAQGANKALQAKERLMKIISEGNKVLIKKSETIIHQSSEPEYDLSKLTAEEKEEFKKLMNKASV